MGWIGGVINLLFGLGNSYENAKISKAWNRSARGNSGQVMEISQKVLDNASKDWDHFKTTFAPAEQAMATQAARDPDIAGAEGKVAGAVASGMSQGGNAVLKRRVNPNSGSTSAALNDITVAGGRARGFGMGQARRGEEDRVFKERAAVSAGARGIPSGTNMVGLKNIDMLQTSIKKAAGVSDAYGGSAADSLYQVGKGAGQLGYGFGKKKTYSSPDYDKSGQADYNWGSKGDADYFNSQNEAFGMDAQFADGGLVEGPGTGRSDSVPAVIDGEKPARVSNGEFIIPARAVAMIGKRNLDALIAKYHRPPLEGRGFSVTE